MLRFKREHVEPILAGRKRQTRRLWPAGPRVKARSLHWCTTDLNDPTARFARIRILRLWQEPLQAISQQDAAAEGFDRAEDYLAAFGRINGVDPAKPVDVWVVEFERVA